MPRSDSEKKAVLMVCDGLRADMITPEDAPTLSRLAGEWCWFGKHTGVFPSTTRATSASIATGCLPGTHGLAGNTMALDEGEGLICRNAGQPDFRERMRRATGATLRVPTMAERLVERGGSVVFSNVSPGAAYFQDPDGFGHVYHCAGSYGPGLKMLPEAEWPAIEKGLEGDVTLTERFCEEVVGGSRPALSVIWLSEPDFSGHNNPLGSPAHKAAIAGADACVARVVETVEALDPDWTEHMMVVCSDHGHETVLASIRIDQVLVDAGLKAGPDSTDVVVAPNGTAALIYLAAEAAGRREALVRLFRDQQWVGGIYSGADLGQVGFRGDTALAIALDMRKTDQVNPFGVPGCAYAALDPNGGNDYTGRGQHGGLGVNEQRPFMLARGGGLATAALVETPSSPIDIAPTLLAHLGIPRDGMQGKVLTTG